MINGFMQRLCAWSILSLLGLFSPLAAQSTSDAPPANLPESTAVAPSDPEQEQAARTAIEAKDFRQARTLYEQLAQRNPANLDYRIRVGRLSGWLQEYAAAQAAYRFVLDANPEHLEALLGMATIAMWQQQYAEARPWLERAQTAAPGNTDVRLAWARFYHYQGQEKQALDEVRSILAVAPANAEALELQRRIELPRRIEVRTGYERNRLSVADPGGNRKYFDVGYIGERGRVNAGVERWSRFGAISTRLMLAASRRIEENWWLRGGVALAGNSTVVPEQEYSLGFSRKLPRGFVVGADYRYASLATAKVQTLAPTVEYYFRHPAWLMATYYRSWTSYRLAGQQRAGNNSFSLRYNHQVTQPLMLYVGYGQGRESFQTILSPSLDRIGQFDASTYLLGAKWQFQKYFWLDVFGVRQRRSTGVRETTLGLGLTTRQ
jgi:YaiO family outer membrane protein